MLVGFPNCRSSRPAAVILTKPALMSIAMNAAESMKREPVPPIAPYHDAFPAGVQLNAPSVTRLAERAVSIAANADSSFSGDVTKFLADIIGVAVVVIFFDILSLSFVRSC